MKFDNSWNALFNPGNSGNYFLVDTLPPFEPEAREYNAANAFWLSELSRLVYKDENRSGAAEQDSGARNAALANVGLRETAFFSEKETQCAIITPGATSAKPFIVVAFRGTSDLKDWLTNLDAGLTRWPQGGQIHQGFKKALDTVWNQVANEVRRLRGPKFYCGHSLGGALATLAASRLPPDALYTYGSPRVGNRNFARSLQKLAVYRIVNHRDLVTTVPPPGPIFKYTHVGEQRYITGDGELLINPGWARVSMDRFNFNAKLRARKQQWWTLSTPPGPLSDHAPQNYSACLAQILSGRL